MNEAPIFVRAFDLHNWLLDRFDIEPAPFPTLRRDLLDQSRSLLHTVSLALARFDAMERLIAADEHATLLRVHLRLANDKKLIDDDQLLYVNRELSDIGRQIGGWQRHLEGVE